MLPPLHIPAPIAWNRNEPAGAGAVQRITAAKRIVLDVNEVSGTTMQSTSAPMPGPKWPMMLFAVYLGIALSFFLRLVLGLVLSGRLAAGSTPLRDSTQTLSSKALPCEQSLSYPLPRLFESDQIRVACVS